MTLTFALRGWHGFSPTQAGGAWVDAITSEMDLIDQRYRDGRLPRDHLGPRLVQSTSRTPASRQSPRPHNTLQFEAPELGIPAMPSSDAKRRNM